MKKLFLLVLLVISVFSFSEQLPATSTVAIVNEEVITLETLNSVADVQKLMVSISQIDQTFFNILSNTEEGIKVILRYKRAILEQLVDKYLIVQFAEKYNARPSDEEVKQLVDEQLSNYLRDQGIDEETFNFYLEYANMGSLEDFKKRMYLNTLVNLSIENLYKAVTKDATITVSEARDYYEKNIDKYATPTQYDLYLLKLSSDSVARDVKNRISGGESFEKVAKELGIDKYFYEGLSEGEELSQKLWMYIKNAPEGAILGPIDDKNGFYLFKILKIIPMRSKPFEEVKHDIIEEMLSSKKSTIWSEFIDKEFKKFKEESDVKIYYEVK
ncbi:hypothetical protein SU69_01350 [Thermosipho melanesiensis]|uniref:PpiC domain-containing protein n=2 Tax=Thermosipho melanesiensis TaxID=46541 RepID=A6LJM8_THEM4|nr:peptidyl-prolyl cis-trans isomerase [Thermosipho melanesiensis]ABR30129.1 hypothetical protein Tmel_0255 [Thermosipho melanesiensis BI429]APT73326.1 hypothetical protein BW47_01390 [Thermosipho melanesiensis]OOC38716.1 hypothetical protein SU68_01350 [Thermosipho melanesiensis]OOC40520.1 hypothetical protein SU70_01350 [Thermosipho melanesiensis]OOC40785.1 hypothetical protein SU69_01350 [Thermosipho melanesiensis]